MIQLESLSIRNFRGFDNLEMKDFSKINVLLGENNCGKTSVLESIFLLTGISNPLLAVTINQLRKITPNKNALKYIFYKLDTQNKPQINGCFSQKASRELEITPIFEKNHVVNVNNIMKTSEQNNPLSTSSLPTAPDIEGLNYISYIKNPHEPKKIRNAELHFRPDGSFELPSGFMFKGDIVSTFLSSENVDAGFPDRLKMLFIAKKEPVINELLSKFDEKIKGIYVLQNDIYLDMEGVSERIPLQLFGNGIRHFLNIATTIASNHEQNFICLIDEIENGLHFKSQELMWQTLFRLTKSANIQLFITTHSWEMLQSLTNVLNQSDYIEMQNSVKVFSIVHTLKDGFQSYARSFDDLDLALENLMEIR